MPIEVKDRPDSREEEQQFPEQPPVITPAITMPLVTTQPPPGGYEPGYPKVFYSVYDARAPKVVKTPAEEAAIDKRNWMTVPPEEPKEEDKPLWPKVFYNVNSPVKIVASEDDEAALGPDWRELKVPEQKPAEKGE